MRVAYIGFDLPVLNISLECANYTDESNDNNIQESEYFVHIRRVLDTNDHEHYRQYMKI